jgi:copper(I)-binding protein
VIARRASVLVALALATPVLAGCGIEAKDETSKEHTQIQAASSHIGAVRIRNAFITSLPDATQSAATGATRSYLVVTLVNNGSDDVLTGISTGLGTSTLNAGPTASVGANGVPLPKGVVVQVSNPEINPDAATVVISGITPKVGTTVPVTFTFQRAGTTRPIAVPVVNPGGSLTPTQIVPTDQATFSTPIE